MSTVSSASNALNNLISWNTPSTTAASTPSAQASTTQTVFTPLDNLVAWNQPSTSSVPATSTTTPATTTPTAQPASTPAMPSALDDLIAYNNQSTSSASSATTVQQARQTVAQTSSSILSSLAPANSSIYNTVDSLLGNASTSSALSALAQVNATLPASSQINVFSSAGDAVSYANDSEAASQDDLIQGALGSVGGNSSLLGAYTSNSAAASDSEPQLNISV